MTGFEKEPGSDYMCVNCNKRFATEGYIVCEDCLNEEYETKPVYSPGWTVALWVFLMWIIIAATYFFINLLVWKLS